MPATAISSRRYSFSNSNRALQPFDLFECSRIDDGDGGLIGEQPEPSNIDFAKLDAAENS